MSSVQSTGNGHSPDSAPLDSPGRSPGSPRRRAQSNNYSALLNQFVAQQGQARRTDAEASGAEASAAGGMDRQAPGDDGNRWSLPHRLPSSWDSALDLESNGSEPTLDLESSISQQTLDIEDSSSEEVVEVGREEGASPRVAPETPPRGSVSCPPSLGAHLMDMMELGEPAEARPAQEIEMTSLRPGRGAAGVDTRGEGDAEAFLPPAGNRAEQRGSFPAL